MTRSEKISILKEYGAASGKLSYTAARMEAAKARADEDIQMLRNLLLLPAAPSDGVRGGSPGDKFASVFAAIDGVERKYAEMTKTAAEKIVELTAKKRAVETAIDSMDDAAKAKVLTLRYIMGMRWAEIADEMDMSESYVRGKLHDDAVDEFEI